MNHQCSYCGNNVCPQCGNPGNVVNSRKLPQVRTPCDIKGPLAADSNWPYEVLIFPTSARPDMAESFSSQQELVIDATQRWLDVISFTPMEGEEGRIIELAGEEVGAAGLDLLWRVVKGKGTIGGSQLPSFGVLLGGWSSILSPMVLPIPVERDMTVSLQVLAPAAGGVPRTVRGLLRGWTAPFDGGGSFASGIGRS